MTKSGGPGKVRRPEEASRVYGPVPSRRLGRSLGVDLVPFKRCPFDCIYCQLGPTQRTAAVREAYFPVPLLAEQVLRAIERGPAPDIITLAGSGEPTLYGPLGELISALKGISSLPVALLTNGALFADRRVRSDAALADLVLPSLDAGDESMFRRINRPHPSLRLEAVVAGLEAFRGEYAGPVWLEVMIVGGLTDEAPHASRIADLAKRIRPDRIQLNTPIRPSPLGAPGAVSLARLRSLCGLFAPEAEVIAELGGTPSGGEGRSQEFEERLLALLARRPCTLEDASGGLAAAPNEVVKALAELEIAGAVRRQCRGSRVYFVGTGLGGGP